MNFPVGGPREPVYNFLRKHGFIMSPSSDKQWTRADGLRLHLYGAGSRARIYKGTDNLIADDELNTAMAQVEFKT